MLLADVFEEFRKICFDNYQLDPASGIILGCIVKIFPNRIRIAGRSRSFVDV